MASHDSVRPTPLTESETPRSSIPHSALRGGDLTTGFVATEGGVYYRIVGFDRMPPFLMSLASDTDLWMFVTSGGGLTAGRVDADGSIFPYETVDKLHDAHHQSGPVTLMRVRRPGRPEILWRPFSERAGSDPGIERNLLKSTTNTRLIFEEVNADLELVFRYRWAASDEFGWVRTATIENRGSTAVSIVLLDGLRNVLPWGAPLALYQRSSSLVDAYRRADCDPETGMAVFSLTAMITDRAEAAEVLRANTVWCHGLRDSTVALSSEAVSAFLGDRPIPPEDKLTGRRGNYFVTSSFELAAGGRTDWHMAADVGRDHVQVAALRDRLRRDSGLDRAIRSGLRAADENLTRIVASADGLQLTDHREATVHHFANVLFNTMRGGVFDGNYDLPSVDFADFIRTRNRDAATRQKKLLGSLPGRISIGDLVLTAERSGDADFQRLTYEYLPLWFGRRHGDPSRPWNRFTIRVRDHDGDRTLRYEGNWRDIFQNWEALSQSFPEFLPSIVAKFVNASTVDGFNPYRVTRDGIDWETVDPRDPWSHIGYWGDHQIVYLLRFLKTLRRFSPGTLAALLDREIFSYADVPYRLKPYEDILADPRATILYDVDLAARVEARTQAVGTDGKLVIGPDGRVYHVTLLEKLLVPALSKLSNLVPDGGIWMNTQRPEWNDANNALVGNGVSVVTLCHLRGYLTFLQGLLEGTGPRSVSVSAEVITWFRRLHRIYAEHRSRLTSEAVSDLERKRLLDASGRAFSEYRAAVYSQGFSGKGLLPTTDVVEFCRIALVAVDRAILANRREDGLYHAYNLLEVRPDRDDATIRPLYEMLEGQVAALSSGLVDPPEAVGLISALFQSRLYAAGQRSFLLYPERTLPGFLDRNVVPDDGVRRIPLLTELIEAGDTSILARDVLGTNRFCGDLRNAGDLSAALDRLGTRTEWREAVTRDRNALLDLFEEVFNHRAFTGRSGTMYGYEGLGCIYWHMVAKLLLAVQEAALRAAREDRPAAIREALGKAYYRIRSGLGFEKTAEEYGAFPTDPYSHTPAHAGAQQPGMTGQVKEEILTRFGELGIHVEDGILSFQPMLLRKAEFLREPAHFRFFDLDGSPDSIDVSAGSLAFSFCQVPVIYHLTSGEWWIRIVGADDTLTAISGDTLDPETSKSIFGRRGAVKRIEVGVAEASLARY